MPSIAERDHTASSEKDETPAARSGSLSRYYLMPKPVKVIFLLAPILAIALFILHWFSVPVFGQVLAGTSYFYLLYAVLGFNVFMGMGASRRQNLRAPAWYDYFMALTLWGIVIFFLVNSDEIAYHNWDTPPNAWVFVSAIVIGALGIEAGRRIGGWGYAALLLVSIVYPLVASHPWLAQNLGGVFYGVSFSFQEVISSFAFGADGMLGIPARMLGEIILGFFLFAGLIMGMGGGNFFMKLAQALMGKVRGGQAKVAVLASGFFGSITGSSMANIAGTGSFTIPAMKKSGYKPEYAGAVEACASAGSDTMPPVMGGMVFMMVVIFGVDYADVVIAAFLPSILYYLGLLVQVDSHAALHNIRPADSETRPVLWKVMVEGWVYLVGLGILIFGLVYMRWGAITPIYATVTVVILLVLQWMVKRWLSTGGTCSQPSMNICLRQAWKQAETGMVQTSGLVNYTVAIFIGMGFLLVGLLKTGVAAGLAAWIISIGGENIYLILGICAVFSLVMGTFGLERTAYIFLAIIAVPAIITMSKASPDFLAYGGIPVIGLNLFLIFYSSLGGITPPVALNAYIAANIAGANPFKTTLIACRLGIVLAFLPFFFVLHPGILIIYSSWWETVLQFAQAAGGIWLLSSALEGYLVLLGALSKKERVLLGVGGFSMAFPHLLVFGIGIAICLLAVGLSISRKRLTAKRLETVI